MRATLSIDLINKETIFFFKKQLSNGGTLYEGVMRKINLIMKHAISYNSKALIDAYQLDEKIKASTDYFYDEIDKFEEQLEKRKPLGSKKVTFIARFTQEVPCSNPLAVSLIEWFETFDKLISTLKLLNLNGCFESREIFQHVERRYQKVAKKLLSSIIFQPSSLQNASSVQEVIKNESSYDWQTLYKAINSQFCPGFSKPLKHQLMYRLKQKISIKDQNLNKEQSC